MTTEKTNYPGILRRGERWIATIPYKDEHGRRRVRWVTCRTLNAARVARRDGLKGLDEGIRPSDATMKLADYLSDWLVHTERSCRPNTVKAYQGVVRRYVEPGIGYVQLRDLDRRTLARFYDAQRTNGIAAACHRTLSAALSYAVEELGLIAANPCRSLTPPASTAAEARHLDTDESRRLLEAVQGHRLEGAVILGLVGGMRLAEVCALEWRDIDFTTGKVAVTKSAWGRTKNGRTRSFTLPESQVVRLHRVKIEQAEHLLLRGVRQSDRTTVVAKTDGAAMAHQTLAGAWTQFAKVHGLTISFHGLRHSNVIALLTSGVDVKTAAADRLGSALAF